MPVVPRIIPIHSKPKECIIVSSKKYCEDTEPTNKDVGMFGIGPVIALILFLLPFILMASAFFI